MTILYHKSNKNASEIYFLSLIVQKDTNKMQILYKLLNTTIQKEQTIRQPNDPTRREQSPAFFNCAPPHQSKTPLEAQNLVKPPSMREGDREAVEGVKKRKRLPSRSQAQAPVSRATSPKGGGKERNSLPRREKQHQFAYQQTVDKSGKLLYNELATQLHTFFTHGKSF
ncbi:MAG: hypothetical protein J5885_01275 [Clostridia bacterium]|nr:hypothetical protein [Clostridia bacterium]